MATNSNWWRSARTKFGTLGQKTFFVDWDFGSDAATADGTPEHPFATISHGWSKLVAAGYTPSGCVVRGHGNESFVGNHAFTISGDYWGAAIWDGGGTSQIIYCTMNNLIYINGGNNIDVDYSQTDYGNNIRAAFAGCGRAHYANSASGANVVSGVASSPIQIENSKLYRGCIGGNTGVVYNIYSKIKATPFSNMPASRQCGVTFGTYSGSASNRCNSCTVYDLPLNQRAISKVANTMALHAYRWLFGKVDFIYEHADFFYNCCFASDCRMFYVDKVSGAEYYNKRLKIIPVVGTNATPTFTYNANDTDVDFTGTNTGGSMTVTGVGITNFYAALVALYANGHVTLNPATYFLQNCVFTSQTSSQIFNNPEHSDFTIKLNSAAQIDTVNYFGALPPSRNIPIVGTGNSGSDGMGQCWDNRSIVGCLKVENGVIKIDTASTETSGKIYSKIVITNPNEVQFNGLFSKLTRRVKRGWLASSINPFDTKIEPDSNLQATLTVGTQYVVKGSRVSFNGETYDINSIIDTASIASLVAQFETNEGYLLPVKDANIPDTLYCRCRSMIYARASLGETLKPQVTYLNDGESYISFHNRVIVPNESFICDNAEQFYVCNNLGVVDNSANSYSIAVIFDDRETIPEGEERIGGVTKWIPAQSWGEYFAMKNAGAITEIDIPQIGNVPKASGNYQCFTKNGGGTIINGYKSILNQPYVQFGIFVTKVSEWDVNVDDE